jgi:hypothetical protein
MSMCAMLMPRHIKVLIVVPENNSTKDMFFAEAHDLKGS